MVALTSRVLTKHQALFKHFIQINVQQLCCEAHTGIIPIEQRGPTEAQRGEATCLGPQNQEVDGLG